MATQRGRIAVLGAGIVGVCCALELQRRGHEVTLFDRRSPGLETSFGNAGVIARSSLVPLNNPALWRALPTLLRNRSASLRYAPSYVARNLPWALRFLAHTRRSAFEHTAQALDALIRLSTAEHRRLLREAGALHRLRDDGWLFLYRGTAGFDAGALARATFERFRIATQVLAADDLHDLEPHLRPIFARALWVKDSSSVDSPGRVVEAYAALFAARGGAIRCASIEDLRRTGAAAAWQLVDAGGTRHDTQRVVVALGPWSKGFVERTLGLRVPMAFERGYHMQYRAAPGATLQRPVHDSGGGYVLAPMEDGLRLSTGVELTALDAAPNPAQLALAEQAARQAFPLEGRMPGEPWLGSRPTLPDSRPMIGECPGHAGVWLAFGHQHIGFGTGPGTAALLGSMIDGEACAFDASPFAAARF